MVDEEIHSESFVEIARKSASDFTRNRNLPFPLLCLFLLRTVRECLSTAFKKFSENIDMKLTMTEQSLSEARNKIRWEAFAILFAKTGKLPYTDDYDTWNGYRLWAIDGTKLALPNMPQLAGQFGDDKGSPTARGSILYDVLNYTTFDAHLEPLAVDERTLAVRHIDALAEHFGPGKDLIIFDRGYPSEGLIAHCEHRGIKYLMRVRRKFNLAVDGLQCNDGVVTIGKHSVRVVKVELDTGETETLITNFTGNADFKQLYFRRWGVEKAYDVLKNTLEIESFSGRTETAVKQDFYAHMLASNLLVASFWEAQATVDTTRNSNPENKYDYKVNVSQAAGTLKTYIVRAILARSTRKRSALLKQMHEEIAKASVPIRSQRHVPRKKNNRSSRFSHNRKSNL